MRSARTPRGFFGVIVFPLGECVLLLSGEARMRLKRSYSVAGRSVVIIIIIRSAAMMAIKTTDNVRVQLCVRSPNPHNTHIMDMSVVFCSRVFARLARKVVDPRGSRSIFVAVGEYRGGEHSVTR